MRKFISIKTAKNNLPAFTMLLLVVLWECIVRIFSIPSFILPGPLAVAAVFEATWTLILSHTAVTLNEALSGFGLSIAVGLLLSFIMNRWEIIRRILFPLLVISQAIPIIALAPLILIWFGVGILPKIVIVILVCFFPICVNTTQGLQSADKDMVNLMKVMGAGHFRIFREVTLQSALPHFFAGLKIAGTYSIMGAVIGEFLGAKSGLGIFMTRTISSYRTDMLFAAAVVVVVLSIGVFKIIELTEKLIIPWNFLNRGHSSDSSRG